MSLPAFLHALKSRPAILATVAASSVLTSCQLPEYAREWASTDSQLTVKRAVSVDDKHQLFAPPVALNLPGQVAPLNDTARLLAGLPATGRDYFPNLRHSSAWAEHKSKLDRLWSDFAWRHETPIRDWAGSQISDLRSSPALFYPFSGPDFLFANTFFPRADTVVLCGLESCEPLPPLSTISAGEINSSLNGLATSINTAMTFSFFITKDMRHDLANTRLKGVLPLVLTFMARTGHSVESVDLIRLDGNGMPVLDTGGNGLLIRAKGPNGAMKRVFYFRQDLSNGGISAGSPFLRFVSSLGNPPAFVKSASYLMHEDGFQTIRNYVTNNCRGIVQDPSGVPFQNLLSASMDVRLYGNYHGTLDMFGSHHQSDLIAAYERGQAQPLNFGIGYLYQADRTCLMVARHGKGRVTSR